jgi:hypothetical protein
MPKSFIVTTLLGSILLGAIMSAALRSEQDGLGKRVLDASARALPGLAVSQPTQLDRSTARHMGQVALCLTVLPARCAWDRSRPLIVNDVAQGPVRGDCLSRPDKPGQATADCALPPVADITPPARVAIRAAVVESLADMVQPWGSWVSTRAWQALCHSLSVPRCARNPYSKDFLKL